MTHADAIKPGKFNWLAACTLIVIVPYLGQLPLWLILWVSGMVAWRYLVEHHGWRPPGAVVRMTLTLTASFIVYSHYGTFLGRDAGLSLLLILLGLKFLEIKARRDRILIIYICYLAILGAFLYSQDLWLGLYLILAVIISTAALMRVQDYTLPALRYFRSALGITLLALPLMVIMYLLFPRIQGGVPGLALGTQSGRTGFSESMQPGSVSQLTNSEKIAFRVFFENNQIPPQAERYWRGLVLWRTDGRTWTQRFIFQSHSSTFTGKGLRYDYRIMLEPHNKPWLFSLDLPTSLPRGTELLPGFVIKSDSDITERYHYQLSSYTQYQQSEQSPGEKLRALQLPAILSSRVQLLANRWRLESTSDEAIVNKALTYFNREEFYYTLKPPLLGGDPVDEFLFESRRGYCEHFASAFTTLMRAAQVPARVVVGYQGGDYNPSGKYIAVRQADAHAWSEVWLEGKGWTRVDPTAAVAPTRIEYGLDAFRRLRALGTDTHTLSASELQQALRANWWFTFKLTLETRWDALNVQWFRWVMDFDHKRQLELLKSFGQKEHKWAYLLAGMFGALLLIVALIATVILLRRQRQDPVHRLYTTYCRHMARYNFIRLPHEGACDFAKRIKTTLPLVSEQIDAITEVYSRIRYGKNAQNSDIQQLRNLVRSLIIQKST
ncbi:MAG: protein-glutamine gamma-glutamyltransferase TgpA [Gammaproteobacteria bacterium]|nr:MAG: protein-glutamine gamma-glutamyltransferase TgpA [Gammaproteobacteria bacterium]